MFLNGREDIMTASNVRSCARGCGRWLSTIALVGPLLACGPSGSEAPDAGGPGTGGNGGSPGNVDAGPPDASLPDTGAAGAPAPGCTNACSTGATRCASLTTLEICAVGSNGCTAFTASTCSSGTVCERAAPADCVDPQWAEWPVPNGAGDVAIGAPHLETLVDNVDGTVTDRVTGLMWEQAFRQSDFQSEALTYCPALVRTAGYSDWRLPTIIELLSIADFTRDPPSIDTTFFPLAGDSGPFWSSTITKGFGDYDEILQYDYGFLGITQSIGLGVEGGPLGQNIRCVR